VFGLKAFSYFFATKAPSSSFLFANFFCALFKIEEISSSLSSRMALIKILLIYYINALLC